LIVTQSSRRAFPFAALKSLSQFIVIVVVSAFAWATAHAQTFTVLYNLTGGTDGATPQANVILDSEGNIYGTTVFGGDMNCPINTIGCGTVFKIDTSGNETVLHAFDATDGASPLAGLVRDSQGNLYGTAGYNGLNSGGILFKLDPNNVFTVLYNFGNFFDGNHPQGLSIDRSGNLFGVTTSGGSHYDGGTLFVFTSNAAFYVLHRFHGGKMDASIPTGPPFIDSLGNLYGVASDDADDPGAFWSYTNQGVYAHRFLKGSPGPAFPEGGLAQDSQGDFLVASADGGAYGTGTIFRANANGAILNYYSFNVAEGWPTGGLVSDANGNFYGATSGGGYKNEYGTVFKFIPGGQHSILHTFSNVSEGKTPLAGLAIDLQGNLYGTTSAGGAYGYGTVFKMTP
jgi:uncharacterized repeat protein (TIGR03803 family)